MQRFAHVYKTTKCNSTQHEDSGPNPLLPETQIVTPLAVYSLNRLSIEDEVCAVKTTILVLLRL